MSCYYVLKLASHSPGVSSPLGWTFVWFSSDIKYHGHVYWISCVWHLDGESMFVQVVDYSMGCGLSRDQIMPISFGLISGWVVLLYWDCFLARLGYRPTFWDILFVTFPAFQHHGHNHIPHLILFWLTPWTWNPLVKITRCEIVWWDHVLVRTCDISWGEIVRWDHACNVVWWIAPCGFSWHEIVRWDPRDGLRCATWGEIVWCETTCWSAPCDIKGTHDNRGHPDTPVDWSTGNTERYILNAITKPLDK